MVVQSSLGGLLRRRIATCQLLSDFQAALLPSERAIAWTSIALPSLSQARPNGLVGDSPHAYPQ
jgi:hypothetical protein